MNAVKKEHLIIVDSRLEKIIPQFINYQKMDLAAVEVAFSERNSEELKRLGHRIKGGCGGYGFHELSRLAADLELAAGVEDYPAIENYIRLMQEQLLNAKIQFVKK